MCGREVEGEVYYRLKEKLREESGMRGVLLEEEDERYKSMQINKYPEWSVTWEVSGMWFK